MMLIPSLSVDTNSADTVQASFFPANNYYSSSASGDLIFGVTNTPASAVSRLSRAYWPTEGRMLATKMQSDLPGFHMYAAAAVAPGQPVSSALNSSGNYAVAAAPAPTHSLVPPHYGPSAIDASSYYSPLGSGYDIKANDMWTGGYGQATAPYYQYDAGFAPQYTYDRYCNVDMNDGVRRKNATRESTNTLKAWLQEHKKNPYPTKGEKIMLAIITKMTLTQVSTWFANARRRLKKENKMTWVPKNRANETGSGTDERRGSEEKDTDEKTEDEECKSEKNDDDQREEDAKLTSEPDSSCQYTQQAGATDIQFPSVPGTGEINPYSTENNALSTLQESKSAGEEYSHPLPSQHSCDNTEMLSANAGANSTLDEKGRYRYDLASSAYGRSIWSPADVHTPRNGSTMSRTCHQNYTSDYYYQSGYHHELQQLHTRRLSVTHSHAHHGEYEGLQLARQASLPNSQECHTVGSQPSSSFSSSKHTSPTPPGNRDASEVMTSMNLGDVTRGSDYNLTSPVTNLRNWVNGVFPGVECPTGVSNQALAGDKGSSGGLSGSPKQQDVSETNQQRSYEELDYSHLHLPRRSTMGFSKSLSVGGNAGESFMLQHRPAGLDQTRYYRDTTSQRTGLAYPHHAAVENVQPDRVSGYPGPAETNYDQSGSGLGGGLCPSVPNFSQSYSLGDTTSMAMGTRGAQLAECSASRDSTTHNTSRFPPHCENTASDHDSAVCQGLSHYDPQGAKPSAVPQSNAPPPPYAIQCKYAHNTTQSIAYMDNQTCSDYSLKVGSGTQLPFGHIGHAPQRIASPKNSHAVSTADEETSYSCKISPGVEVMKLRTIHDQEAPPDSTEEP